MPDNAAPVESIHHVGRGQLLLHLADGNVGAAHYIACLTCCDGWIGADRPDDVAAWAQRVSFPWPTATPRDPPHTVTAAGCIEAPERDCA